MSLEISLTSEEIENLLNPYQTREVIVSKWKETLTMFKKPGTLKNIEWLAQILKNKYHIPAGAISSLFNRKYVEPVEETETCPDLKMFFHPISFEDLDKFDYSDEEFVLELKKRLEYPKSDEKNRFILGLTNSDLDSDSENPLWCHLAKDTLDDDVQKFHHGLLKCQCYCKISKEGFTCKGCGFFYFWKTEESEDFVRFPIIDQDLGGWGDFYCSRECLVRFSTSKVTNMHDIILEMIESTLDR